MLDDTIEPFPTGLTEWYETLVEDTGAPQINEYELEEC